MFQRMLVATDLSPRFVVPLRAALELARTHGSSVTVAHVIEKPSESSHWLSPLFDEEMQAYQGALQREQEKAQRLIVESIVQAGGEGVTTTAIVRTGRAAETIVALGAELDVDLIVVGTHGREGTIGSVAERITRAAHRPVLTIPHRSP